MRFSIVAYKTRLRVIRKNRQYFVIGMYYVYSVIKMFDWEDLSKNVLCIAMKLVIFTLHQNEIFKLLKSNLSELDFFYTRVSFHEIFESLYPWIFEKQFKKIDCRIILLRNLHDIFLYLKHLLSVWKNMFTNINLPLIL